ncbi:hypothetical protein LJC60_09805 [Ruminococcaceae bacterium OttesenSCG-928-D13]|nr:hypothetical protein [Ruminococcaceae bacterium OttesenSCG-928-D13]
MRVKKGKKTDSSDALFEMLKAAAENHEFNIATDLRELQKQHGRTTKPEFKKCLAALVEKYTTGEFATVHEVLIKRCREGDVAAIRLWHEINRAGDAGGGGDEVVIVNDLG